MANIASQKKRNRQNEKARLANKGVRSELRTRIKQVEAAAANGEETVESLRLAIKRLDMAAQKNVIHKNQAANRKSGLVRRINALQAAK